MKAKIQQKLTRFAVVVAVVAAASTARAVSIDYAFEMDGQTKTTTVAGATVWDFNTGGIPWADFSMTGGGAAIVSGSTSGRTAAPGLTDDTPYLVVPSVSQSNDSGSITVYLDATYNYFGLYWGSVDSYNTVSFLMNGTVVESFTGTQAISPSIANGNQTSSATNSYINFHDIVFNGFTLASDGRALEVDNIAVAISPVPEPGTMILLGSGLLGLAGYGRKRKAS